MKKVLVTGATGFVGRWTLNKLIEKGYEVYAISSKKHKNNSKFIYWHICDLLELSKIDKLFKEIKPTHLLHFAWYTEPAEYKNSNGNLSWVQSSIEIIKAFKKNGGKRAVIAGTCFEYDLEYGYLIENLTPSQPNTLYGICKLGLQKILKDFSKKNDLSLAWGRIFYIYGPFENSARIIPYVINSLLDEKKALCSHGNQIRDYLYIEDAASAFVNLLDSKVEGIVNIGSGQAYQLKEIFTLIEEKIGGKNMIELGKLETALNEPHIILADIDRLNNEVRWKPQYDLSTGLDKTINWWRERREV
ncbi:NAD(P)-dependent oxidoreductase [Halocella sp. SP3-1]|uniref:NAD-dependent epimerase/dehydratase family protein n=1 Tax=Halocella sp. SP3-1 TaxID=2382161 RepID=UPI000F74E054|nr:NAD(P)-dependent oxidoreductase [Halocella sp. SP3-1]AZO96313.1 NAD(P)-dependent oxidoreductase [Halocella sp. SP3-1]